MNLLHWQDVPPSSKQPDPWFGITMGLLGVIAGYIIGNAVL